MIQPSGPWLVNPWTSTGLPLANQTTDTDTTPHTKTHLFLSRDPAPVLWPSQSRREPRGAAHAHTDRGRGWCARGPPPIWGLTHILSYCTQVLGTPLIHDPSCCRLQTSPTTYWNERQTTKVHTVDYSSTAFRCSVDDVERVGRSEAMVGIGYRLPWCEA